MKRKIALSVLVLAVLGGGICYITTRRAPQILLTGIVTTDQTIVSSEIQGRLQQLLVKEADTVKSNQLVGLIQPQEWKADMAFYANSEQQSVAQVAQAEADLKYQASATSNQIWQAEANLAAAKALLSQAAADLENVGLTISRGRPTMLSRRVWIHSVNRCRRPRRQWRWPNPMQNKSPRAGPPLKPMSTNWRPPARRRKRRRRAWITLKFAR